MDGTGEVVLRSCSNYNYCEKLAHPAGMLGDSKNNKIDKTLFDNYNKNSDIFYLPDGECAEWMMNDEK